jgi:hypothetical protein
VANNVPFETWRLYFLIQLLRVTADVAGCRDIVLRSQTQVPQPHLMAKEPQLAESPSTEDGPETSNYPITVT